MEHGAMTDSKLKPRLLELVDLVNNKGVVDTKLLMERVQPSTLKSAGIINLDAKVTNHPLNVVATDATPPLKKINCRDEVLSNSVPSNRWRATSAHVC